MNGHGTIRFPKTYVTYNFSYQLDPNSIQSSIPELTIQREYNMFEFNLKFNHIEIKYPTFISFANLYTQGKNYFINNIITIL